MGGIATTAKWKHNLFSKQRKPDHLKNHQTQNGKRDFDPKWCRNLKYFDMEEFKQEEKEGSKCNIINSWTKCTHTIQ